MMLFPGLSCSFCWLLSPSRYQEERGRGEVKQGESRESHTKITVVAVDIYTVIIFSFYIYPLDGACVVLSTQNK